MFIMLKGPIEKSDGAIRHTDPKIKLALINISEIAGITQMNDGGLWISPVNRDSLNIKPEEYYFGPEQADALLAALKPYVINEPIPLTDDQTSAAGAAIYQLAVVLSRQIAQNEAVDRDALNAASAAAHLFGMSDVLDSLLWEAKVGDV